MRKTLKFIILILFSIETLIGQNKLLIPDTLMGTNFTLNLQNGTYQFKSGTPTNTMGVNGNILGPTLILNKGDYVSMHVFNNLIDTTTIHWHGMHVSAENDGGPHTFILPGQTWSPSFYVMDHASTFWYHPHLHHKTDLHASKGIAGMIIVKDSIEESLILPRNYGVDDIPLVIQTKDFDSNNQIVVHSNSDDVLMVNATIDPFVDVPSQVIRFRVLNGSSQRTFNLGLSDNRSFYQIASDGGLLDTPYKTTRLMISPGERAEILIDFSGLNGQSINLVSYASELQSGIYGAKNPGMMAMMTLNGYNPNPLNGADFKVIEFKIQEQNGNPVTLIPTFLTSNQPWSINQSNITRILTFSPAAMGPNQLNGNFLINNTSFDMNKINFTIPLNNLEIWELRNNSAIAHPFHIHDVQFYVLDRNGVAPPVNERGRKDVILIKSMETVRFITKFEDFSNASVPYMYHCHLLTHEDGGMMGQFVVENNSTSTVNVKKDGITIYPNPANDFVNINIENSGDIEIYDMSGILILNKSVSAGITNLNIGNFNSGIYVIKYKCAEFQIITRLIKI